MFRKQLSPDKHTMTDFHPPQSLISKQTLGTAASRRLKEVNETLMSSGEQTIGMTIGLTSTKSLEKRSKTNHLTN